MKSHIQGIFILLGVAIALLALANIAAPVVSDAFGEDGAIVAESAPEDVVELAAGEGEIAAPLNGEEVALLQANLTDLGFDPGPVDGILGSGTRAAINEAILEYQLDTTAADRDVLDYTQSLIDALAAADVADDPGDLSLTPQGDEAGEGDGPTDPAAGAGAEG
ncbi:MAG: peptidoglycan-binding domain-containing protein [Actinomycetota bacterium]